MIERLIVLLIIFAGIPGAARTQTHKGRSAQSIKQSAGKHHIMQKKRRRRGHRPVSGRLAEPYRTGERRSRGNQ
jgi:hypothetical protein